ncbi:hypothetical protein QNO08_00850 [Arthrobacter sp. zg-Y820]|uniref:hypothetical protein n=1 Tax=unclassified Arthrobacter TaxID=235627 RepID=UPI001E410799|nr:MULTISPECIES: hypothetical protein [unclassified Arthrobacter]MCC9197530.1 hypothetical protein [Arthrobacter sp. zg-Y820]MDK1280397.1 hypothetical protein [Arthrobacter sp. zg.Y820]MDK1360468.1 hypothetical protein [Arthrobacter sp. zg-Y1219]WIB09676.1 hypothetical protein QNO08_00850 [Arthrobacter sp. zg-Y820]
MDRFRGYIAGIGTTSGTRLVVGHWLESPFGAFTDVMAENAAGSRLLLAPDPEVAEYIGRTYHFDAVDVVDVDARLSADRLMVGAGPLRLNIVLGPRTLLGRLLEMIPPALAVHPRWLAAINPVAGLLVPGVSTAGSAGGERREYYGVRSIRSAAGASAMWNGRDLGGLSPINPPVRFGFSSVPPRPQIVAVTTSILP